MPGPKKKPYIHKIAETTVKWKKREKDAPMMIGYARVSMSDQNNQRQVDELVKFGVHPSDIFQDKQSGKTMDRKAWQACFRDLQKGDLLVIYTLDRLGRKLTDLIDIEKQLYEKGVKLKIIAQDIDTSNASGRMIFHILGALAQWEREWNWERTMHGLAAARERGVIGGQPSPFSDKQIRQALRKAKTVSGAAKILKCAKVTIHRRMKEWEAARVAA
jgi:DNA invertase Pin-like site-specific DNA recombinase